MNKNEGEYKISPHNSFSKVITETCQKIYSFLKVNQRQQQG